MNFTGISISPWIASAASLSAGFFCKSLFWGGCMSIIVEERFPNLAKHSKRLIFAVIAVVSGVPRQNHIR